MTSDQILAAAGGALALAALAPLFVGLIATLRARFSGRPGPPLLQEYRELAKLARKVPLPEGDSVFSTLGPAVALGATAAAAALGPTALPGAGDGSPAAAFALVALLALARFAAGIVALDGCQAEAALTTPRTTLLAGLAEAALLLALLAFAVTGASARALSTPAGLLAGAGLTLAVLVPMTRLERSTLAPAGGAGLAVLELARQLRSTALAALLANHLLPWGLAESFDPVEIGVATTVLGLKLALVALAAAVIPTSLVRLRLSGAVDLLGGAVALSALALLFAALPAP